MFFFLSAKLKINLEPDPIVLYMFFLVSMPWCQFSWFWCKLSKHPAGGSGHPRNTRQTTPTTRYCVCVKVKHEEPMSHRGQHSQWRTIILEFFMTNFLIPVLKERYFLDWSWPSCQVTIQSKVTRTNSFIWRTFPWPSSGYQNERRWHKEESTTHKIVTIHLHIT